MNTLVIAALALIVLIILIAIFTGKISLFSNTASSCTANGGRCTAEPCNQNEVLYLGQMCPNSEERCCHEL